MYYNKNKYTFTKKKRLQYFVKGFEKEANYMVIMKFTKTLLKDGVITDEDYRKIEKRFIEKYNPTFGTLYSDLTIAA